MTGFIAYLLLVLAWVIFFFSHSFLAASSIKMGIQSNLKLTPKTYRLFYNIISVILLLAVLFINGMIKSERLMPASKFIQYISLLLAGIGVIVINVAFRQYDFKSFVGFTEEKTNRLNTKGILQHVRHPIYSGTILIVLGLLLYDFRLPTLVTVICIFVYLPVGIRLEEKKLVKIFGEEYLRYKKTTPAVIPRIRFF